VGSEKGRTVYAKIIWRKNHAKILLVFHAKLFMQAKNWITKNSDTGCIEFKKYEP